MNDWKLFKQLKREISKMYDEGHGWTSTFVYLNTRAKNYKQKTLTILLHHALNYIWRLEAEIDEFERRLKEVII